LHEQQAKRKKEELGTGETMKGEFWSVSRAYLEKIN
jgi:hypothetical protein